MQATTINMKIKFESPSGHLLPAVLEEQANDYFDLDGKISPYMLLVAPINGEHRLPLSQEDADKFGVEKREVIRSTLPAITHVDYSLRDEYSRSGRM